MKKVSSYFAALCVLLAVTASAPAQTAGMQAFQGRLKQSGTPVNVPVSLEFRVFDAATAGNQVDVTGDGQVTAADTFTQSNVPASNGLISTKFGPVHPSAFNGCTSGTPCRWLEVTIAGPPPVTTLPRLEMATAPAAAERLNVPGTGNGAVVVARSFQRALDSCAAQRRAGGPAGIVATGFRVISLVLEETL